MALLDLKTLKRRLSKSVLQKLYILWHQEQSRVGHKTDTGHLFCTSSLSCSHTLPLFCWLHGFLAHNITCIFCKWRPGTVAPPSQCRGVARIFKREVPFFFFTSFVDQKKRRSTEPTHHDLASFPACNGYITSKSWHPRSFF